MTADFLREAATTLRTLAEDATPGPWKRYGMAGVAAPNYWEIVDERRVECDGCSEPVALTGCATNADAAYIAAMNPAVGLLLADWLEAKAEQDDKGTCDDPRGCCNLCEHDYGHVAALAVARAVLGRES